MLKDGSTWAEAGVVEEVTDALGEEDRRRSLRTKQRRGRSRTKERRCSRLSEKKRGKERGKRRGIESLTLSPSKPWLWVRAYPLKKKRELIQNKTGGLIPNPRGGKREKREGTRVERERERERERKEYELAD
jgi:hypothetical protein